MTVRSVLLFTAAILCPALCAQPAPALPSTHSLWYTAPAAKREEALPVGDCRLGATIFGGSEKERLQLNDITVWPGKPEH